MSPARRFLNLSDQQLDAVMLAARPMQPFERSAFLAALAHLLEGRSEVGDGELHRCLRDLQREHFRPPLTADLPPKRETREGVTR